MGTYLALSTLERYWWGEGEMKFYIDGDKDYPTICGTGTEDYFGGAWSFTHQEGGRSVEQTYCTPFLGYPYYSTTTRGCTTTTTTTTARPCGAFTAGTF